MLDGDAPKSGKQLQTAVLRYDTLAACAPAAYQTNITRHGIHEVRRQNSTLPRRANYRRDWSGRQPSENIRHLRTLLAADRKRAIKDIWRGQAQDIVLRWKAMRVAIKPEAPVPSGLWTMLVPNTQALLTKAHDVMASVHAFWRELYSKRPALQSALDKADWQGPGPQPHGGSLHQSPPSSPPSSPPLVHSYRAILPGVLPPTYWRDAHIWLSPKVPGSAKLDDYHP